MSSSAAILSSAGRPLEKECSTSSRVAGRPSLQHEKRTVGSWIRKSNPPGTRRGKNFRTTHNTLTPGFRSRKMPGCSVASSGLGARRILGRTRNGQAFTA